MIVFPFIIGGAAVVVGAAASARWNWWRRSRGGVPILMYHKVGDMPPGSTMRSLWVTTVNLRKQMKYLAEKGYHPITFRDVYNHWDGIRPLPDKPVLITFDDGYQNNYTHAFPVLKEFGFPATLFAVVQTIGWDNHWHDPASEIRLPMISWAQLTELQSAGWEIGSHTMNHPRLMTLAKADAAVEISRSRQIIGEFLGEVPQTFAYPYGNGEDDALVRHLVQEAGYRLAVGVHTGKWTLDQYKESAFNLPRLFVRGDDTAFDFHLQLTRGRSRF